MNRSVGGHHTLRVLSDDILCVEKIVMGTPHSEALKGLRLPCEGVFWYINKTLIISCNYISDIAPNPYGEVRDIQTWNDIVEGKLAFREAKEELSNSHYVWFPRGRVCVSLVYGKKNRPIKYEGVVFADPCIIDNQAIRNMIESEFGLHFGCDDIHYDYKSPYRLHFASEKVEYISRYCCHQCHPLPGIVVSR